MLHVGQVIEWGTGAHEVLRVTECSALVRPTAREPHEFLDPATGEIKTIWSRGRAFHIAPAAIVDVVKG